MNVFPKSTQHKESAIYKSLYIKDDLAKKVSNLADQYNTSFNNIIISMIEYYFENEQKKSNNN